MPGTYTENLTLKAGVNLTSWGSDSSLFGSNGNVTIVGKLTFTGSGTVNIYGIALQTNSDFFAAVTGSSASVLNFNNCNFNCANNTGISFTSSNSSSQITCQNCTGNIATTGIALFSSSSTGAISFLYAKIGNGGGSTTASTVSAGVLSLVYSNFDFPVTTSSSASLAVIWSAINTSSVTPLTVNGSGNNTMQYSNIGVNANVSAISIGASGGINSRFCEFFCIGTYAISGTGFVILQCTSFSNGTQLIDPAITVNKIGTITGIQNGQAVTAGYLGQQIRSAVGTTSVTSSGVAQNLTSISLTAGIWDVSAGVWFQSTGVSGTQFEMAINTTSATIPAQNGDNSFQFVLTALNISLSAPSYRITLSSTTTVYLVVKAFFGSGMNAAGRISATRVG